MFALKNHPPPSYFQLNIPNDTEIILHNDLPLLNNHLIPFRFLILFNTLNHIPHHNIPTHISFNLFN